MESRHTGVVMGREKGFRSSNKQSDLTGASPRTGLVSFHRSMTHRSEGSDKEGIIELLIV